MTAAIAWALLVAGYAAGTIALVRQARSVPPPGQVVPMVRRNVAPRGQAPLRRAA